jgi:hypothetical protein
VLCQYRPRLAAALLFVADFRVGQLVCLFLKY